MRPVIIKHLTLRRAWYALLMMASLLPAIALTPWLSHQAETLLLDRALLSEEVFHKEIEIRLNLETERLVSVLKNKSDPIAYFIHLKQDDSLIEPLLAKISHRDPVINTTTIYDLNGRIRHAVHDNIHTAAHINTTDPAFVIPMHKRVFIGSPEKLDDGHFEFLISVPLIYNDQVLGAMTSTININAFWQSISARAAPHHSRIYLVDGHGSLMNEPADSQHQQGDLLSSQPIVRALLAHQDWHKKEAYSGMEAEHVFGIGTQASGLAWGIISEIQSTRISDPIISALTTLSIIVITLHLFFGLLSLMFTGHLLNPISELARVMKHATEGDYSERLGRSSIRELQHLAQSFNIMVGEIDKRESTLRQMTRAIDELGEAIIITNREGIIEYINPAFTHITGYSSAEVIGNSTAMLNAHTQSADFYEKLWATILSGECWGGRLINRKKDGSLYPALMSIAPIHDGDSITHYVAVQQDMSEQDRLEDQLRQSQKMEAIGTLVGGIAHDFNNMLAGITGNLYLARQFASTQPDITEKLDNIDHLSHRAADMIGQLLTFARKDRVNMQPIDLNTIVATTIRFMRASIPENIVIQQHLCDEDITVFGDETQLHQVLMNLLNNARDALNNRTDPAIHIELERMQSNPVWLNRHPGATNGDYAHLSIRDNGDGIPEDQIDHLFEPFFTTKEQGKGTGLGLSMVFGAVNTHAGFIDIDSVSGDGSTFHIYIPLYHSQVVKSNPDVVKACSGNGETILLVDDDIHVRQTTADVLKAMGYRVLQAEDGVEALSIFQAHQHDIRMAILDVIMPRCGGAELAEQIRTTHPDLPTIFVTGYDKEHLSEDVTAKQHCIVMSKPVRFEELGLAIQQLLNT